MNVLKKIALGLAIVAGAQVTAGQLTFDSFLKGAANKEVAFRVLEEIVKKYPKLVVYFGDKKKCHYCVTTEKSITAVLTRYPDVMFVMIDLAKYPFFKNGTMPKVRFHLNGIEAKLTDSLTVEKLKELLDQYYR